MSEKLQNFEDLVIWQEARKLTKRIYFLLKDCNDFGFRDQIQRASVSIMNNLAEGFERVTIPEKVQLYRYAKGSAGEVRSMVYVGADIGILSQENFDELYGIAIGISQGIAKFIQGIEKYKK